jgi:carbamoyltransferase
MVCQYVADVVARFGGGAPQHLFLAGGLFANVRVNQKIAELPSAKSVYIFPNMSDAGLNLGAAMIYGFTHGGFRNRFDVSNLYWGRPFTDEDIEAELRAAGVPYRRPASLARAVAALIRGKKVVGRFGGAMEYGPRALGNRSIIYSAEDPSVNQWLNTRLNRTEFMPFAPYVRDVDVPEYFQVPSGELKPYLFMTMTCDVTERCRREAPGIVHVDGTARPQIVFRNEKPREAIQTFRQGRLDVLAIGGFIVERQDPPAT